MSEMQQTPLARKDLLPALREITSAAEVLTEPRATQRYRSGFRFGNGSALAVVRPGNLLEMWRVLEACLRADVIVITQASNTGLTGGSTPDGDVYDRPIVIVSTTRMREVRVIDEGRQVVCLPGATLDQLEKTLKPLGREPHSVIGSSCIGASVFGGVCNNSGGSLVQRGPAYTELAVFAQVDASGKLRLINHLGIDLGDTPEAILGRLDRGDFQESDIRHGTGAASDGGYATHVRDVDADTPARFNADPQRLFEAAGSAGKLMVFAVRLDTFPTEQGARVFYIGTSHARALTQMRRDILSTFSVLPIAGEYLHRDAFDIAETYGKDMFLLIDHLGTARIPALFAWKGRIDAWLGRFGLSSRVTERVMQTASRFFPSHLPPRIKAFRHRFEHHLMLKVSAQGASEASRYLEKQAADGEIDFFECSDEEGRKAFLHRFAAAGAAVRYRAIHHDTVEDIVALDIALRRNDQEWEEHLPETMDEAIAIKLYYGHFLCHVFHQDYIVRKGHDCLALEHEMWKLLDARGAAYPAEHNVGHLYEAQPALKEFYQELDPCNCFNPGIGKMSKFAHYREVV